MSTIILDELKDTSFGRNISLFVVATGHTEVEDLADFVRRIRHEKGVSLRDVEMKSGGAISKGYIGQIENRTVLGQSVTPQKLSALARGLQVPEDEVFAVARGKSLTYEDPLDLRGLFDGWDEASEEDRAATLDDLRMIAERFQRRLKESQKESAAAVKGNPKIARVASPLHPPGWETRPGAGRDGEQPIFSAGKQGKKSQQSKKSRQA